MSKVFTCRFCKSLYVKRSNLRHCHERHIKNWIDELARKKEASHDPSYATCPFYFKSRMEK